MLYQITKSYNGKKYAIIIGADGNDSPVSARDIIKDSSIFSNLLGLANVKIAMFPGTQIPELVLTENSSNVGDVTNVYEALLKAKSLSSSGEISQQNIDLLKNALLRRMPNKNQVYTIMAVALTYVNDRDEAFTDPINIAPDNILDECYSETKKFIDNLRKESSWPFTELKMIDNVTKYQNTFQDELFIAIPDRADLLEADSESEFLPKPEQLCMPYGNSELKDMSQYDEPDSNFPKELYHYVEGKKENNGAPLYPNEMKYHKALIEWIQFNMKADAYTEIDVSPSSPNIDKLSQMYLENLSEFCYARHWAQNINIPIIVETDSDEYTDDDVSSKYSFRMTKDEKAILGVGIAAINAADLNTHRQNALLQLRKYLKAASLSIGFRAYVDAIIQLCRWGERKPTMLVLDGYSLTFSLADNSTRAYIGNASNYDLIKVDGCDSVIRSVFYYDTPFEDYKFLQKYGVTTRCLTAPIGICAEQHYVNNTSIGLGELKPTIYYSIIDVVKQAMGGNCIVAGIKYENGQFTCSKDVLLNRSYTYSTVLNAINNSDSFVEPIKVSSTLEDLLMEFDISTKLNHFNILQQLSRQDDLDVYFKRMHFSTPEELEASLKTRKILKRNPAMGFNIGSVILPIVAKVSAMLEGKDYSFTDVLNAYAKVMLEMSYDSEADFRRNTGAVLQTEQVRTESVTNSDTKSMHLFTDNSQGTVEETSKNPAEPDGMVIEEESHLFRKCEKPTVAILLRSANNSFIGGYYMQTVSTGTVSNGRPVTLSRRYFFGPDTLDELVNRPPANIQRKMSSVSSIIPHLIKTLLYYDKKQWNKVGVFFEDEATLEYYMEKITELLKKKEL